MRLVLTVSVALNIAFVILLIGLARDDVQPSALAIMGETGGNIQQEPGDVASPDDEDSNMIEFADPLVASSPVVSESQRVEVAALPGLSGFDVSSPVIEDSRHPALLLAAEMKDPGWAFDMESQIFAEISKAQDGPMTRLELECRTTWCGLVIDLPQGEDRNARKEIGNHLRDTFKFARISRIAHGRVDGTSFIAIYLKSDRFGREPERF